MEIKDRIISWFVRNVIIPKMEIINKSGFIICKVTEKKTTTFLRELFLPESLYCSLEERMFLNYSKSKAHKILYSIGKKFGYIYSSLSNFPNVKISTEKEIENFIYYFIRYMEATYAKKIGYKINFQQKLYEMIMDNYVICRYNGIGHLLSDGGSAGVWAYMLQDPTIEAVQPKCQGRGDKECLVVSAPYETLTKMGYKPIKCIKLEKMKLTNNYIRFNKIRETKYSKYSLRDLIDIGFFQYSHGQITYNNERFFLCEASFMYILEKELKKVKNGLKVLWDCSFEFGKKLTEISKKQDPCKFIMDFFPALGFGDILATESGEKYKIYVNYFPWLNWWKDIDFTMFRGMLSGVISGFTEKKVELKKIKKDTSRGHLSLFIS